MAKITFKKVQLGPKATDVDKWHALEEMERAHNEQVTTLNIVLERLRAAGIAGLNLDV